MIFQMYIHLLIKCFFIDAQYARGSLIAQSSATTLAITAADATRTTAPIFTTKLDVAVCGTRLMTNALLVYAVAGANTVVAMMMSCTA